MKKLFLLTAIAGLGLSQAFAADNVGAVIKNNDAEAIGHINVKQASGGVLINLKVKNLPPGRHGMHFHEKGDCSDHDHFKAAGGHIGHYKPHGYLHPEGPHAGNLPNLIVHEDGSADVELYSHLVSMAGGTYPLLDEDGSALMIHEHPDDHVTQPIGGSGARIACGVIQVNK